MNEMIIIAGATGGIGSAVVKQLMKKEKYLLLALHRNKEKFIRLYEDCMENGTRECSYEALKDTVDSIIDENTDIKRIVIVLTTFTIQPIKRVENLETDEIIKNMNSNILLNMLIIRDVLRSCKRKGQKLDIINLDSGAAYHAIEGWSLYSSSKIFINMFLKSVIEENKDVRCVSLDPGVVDTDMQAVIRQTPITEFGMVETFRAYKQNNKLASAKEVAEYIERHYIEDWIVSSFEEKYRKE